jgi:hypothetical protein
MWRVRARGEAAAGELTASATLVVSPSDLLAACRLPVFAIISPNAENYYRAVSYGRMNLILEPSYVWRRMSKPTTAYGWNALSFDLHRAVASGEPRRAAF